jgi:hypothetical protein
MKKRHPKPTDGALPTACSALDYSSQSLHFRRASPQGMMGTLEVEFFGLPSISLSE